MTTTLSNEETFGLGELVIEHPGESFPVTPATRIALEAMGRNQHRLAGRGIDWGCGSGPLAIAAARIEQVDHVLGMDILEQNVETSRRNAATNNVADRTTFAVADSFEPRDAAGRSALAPLRGNADFIIANTPSSEGDDGFSFRRQVLREATDFLAENGFVFLNISIQYGRERIAALATENRHLRPVECLATTDWVPFDLGRPDLLACLEAYVEEEERGGLPYEFRLPDGSTDDATAVSALDVYRRTGESPLTKWQMRLFVKCDA